MIPFFVAGLACLLAGLLLFRWATRLHHRADAPEWARSQGFASVACLGLVALLPLGAGLAAYGFEPALAGPEGAALAVLAALTVALWPRGA